MKFVFIAIFFFTFFSQAGNPEDIINKYFNYRPNSECRDCGNPYHSKVIALGIQATPFLLKSLGNDSVKETMVIYLLGEIGDPNAFSSLLQIYKREQQATKKWRIGISLGSSLSNKNIKTFINELSTPDGIKTLKEISKQDFGKDVQKWEEWFMKNLSTAIEYCKARSTPILG